MGPKVVLHIGHGKTGSSYLQSSLALSREQLRAADIDYPDHPSLRWAAEGRISSGNIGYGDNPLRYIAKAAKKTRCGTLLFSSESMFRKALREWDEFRKVPSAFDTRLILFVRDPFDYLYSAYAQAVKRHGYTESLDVYAKKFAYPREVRRVLEFARDEDLPITIFNYSRHKTNLLDVFSRALSADERISLVRPRVDKVNRSLSAGELLLQIEFNKLLGSESGRFVSDVLCNEVPEIEKTEALVDQRTYDTIRKRIAPEVTRVNRLLPPAEVLQIDVSTVQVQPTVDANMACFSSQQLAALARSVSQEILEARKPEELGVAQHLSALRLKALMGAKSIFRLRGFESRAGGLPKKIKGR